MQARYLSVSLQLKGKVTVMTWKGGATLSRFAN
jgi:hypothetical protein